jgi:hypothetical protein
MQGMNWSTAGECIYITIFSFTRDELPEALIVWGSERSVPGRLGHRQKHKGANRIEAEIFR